ncbi:MAG: type II toxin-antitoxin system RelE/ParE family toxin [Nitrospirota bacterium]|nr:type II toxin-antitoxin system RelE/ParE family toxin [Nitrospirota bacterium]
MSYALGILPRAQRELGALPTEIYQRLREAIFELAYEPRPQSSRKMIGREGWRLRVGDYRVLYEIDDVKQAITIVHVGHRRDVYR